MIQNQGRIRSFPIAKIAVSSVKSCGIGDACDNSNTLHPVSFIQFCGGLGKSDGEGVTQLLDPAKKLTSESDSEFSDITD